MKEEKKEWECEWTETLLFSAARLLVAVELLEWSCGAANGGEGNGWWNLSAVCAAGEPSASSSTKPSN